MSMEFKIRSFDVGKEPFVDDHGNTWCTVVFEEIGEPIKWVVKDPSSVTVGDTVYGRIEDKTSKAGKPYQRFYKEQREESHTGATQDAPVDWDDKNRTIRAQWAIGQAVSATELKASDDAYYTDVEHLATQFFSMVERVKETKQEDKPFDPAEEEHNNEILGYPEDEQHA
jgi:hypothetical protein